MQLLGLAAQVQMAGEVSKMDRGFLTKLILWSSSKSKSLFQVLRPSGCTVMDTSGHKSHHFDGS